jgi:hypothetical protein
MFFLLTLFIASLGLMNCKKQNNDNPIETKWHLSSKSGGFAGGFQEYNRDEISWTFDGETLTVVNNVAFGSHDLFENGNYSYVLIESNGEKILKVDGVEIGTYSIENNNLSVSENIVDGYYYQFEK